MLSPEAIRAELEKVLASECFIHAERLRSFLRFTVEHTLDNPSQALRNMRLALSPTGGKSQRMELETPDVMLDPVEISRQHERR